MLHRPLLLVSQPLLYVSVFTVHTCILSIWAPASGPTLSRSHRHQSVEWTERGKYNTASLCSQLVAAGHSDWQLILHKIVFNQCQVRLSLYKRFKNNCPIFQILKISKLCIYLGKTKALFKEVSGLRQASKNGQQFILLCHHILVDK